VPVVLLIEDDEHIRAALRRALEERGHAVRSAIAGMEALAEIIEHPPDVVVLDLGLPDIDGRELLRMLRAVSQVPVIVATARDDETVIVATLRDGADDYVVKPFSAEQLEARIHALLRRGKGEEAAAPPLIVGELRIDAGARAAWLGPRELELTRKEFDLLHYLASRIGRVVTKRELLSAVWQQPYGGADKTVDVHISWLRRKLGESATAPRYLRSVRGAGIKLVDPTQ
jgi:DNA-binding response OmpR family regulator